MDFLRNLFSKKQSAQTETDGRNPRYEELLRNKFGLEFLGNGWSFEGSVNQTYVSVLSNAETCLGVIKHLRADLGFNQVCIVVASPSVLIVCNHTPPLGMLTSLNTSDLAGLVASIIKANGKKVYEYHGVWLLSLN